MKPLFIIAQNTVLQALRQRFLPGLCAIGFAVLCLSLAFAQLSLDDQGRLTTDFGLSAVQLLLAGLAVFFPAGFIAGDLDKKIWMILTRPVRPAVFFAGRYMGLAVLIAIALLALSLILLAFFLFLKIPIQGVLFYALGGFFLESLLLSAFVLLFASYAQSFMVLFYCCAVFIIGHFTQSLFYFIEKTPGVWRAVLEQLVRLIPNLEKVNWKSAVVYRDKMAFSEFALSSLYILLWIGLALSLAFLIMEKREYG